MIGIDRRCPNKCRTECGVAARAASADSDAGADVTVLATPFTTSQHQPHTQAVKTIYTVGQKSEPLLPSQRVWLAEHCIGPVGHDVRS